MTRSSLWVSVAIIVALGATVRAAADDRVAGTPVAAAKPAASAAAQQAAAPPSSPLTIRLGDADFLIGGLVDSTAVMRNTNHGGSIASSFGTIPFANTTAGNLSETCFSSQNSRVTLLVTSQVGRASVRGYIETDFSGNAPAGLNVTTNGNTLRLRLYYAQFRRGKFEFVGGQAYSLLTPNRNGLSPAPGDVFFGQTLDTNFQMGLTWTRAPQFRFIAHPNDVVTAGVALENPEQYVGSAVVLPAAFSASQVDTGVTTTQVPNPYPDVIGKIAFDPKTGATRQHIEAAVLVRGFKTYNPTTASSFTGTGTGFSANAVVEPVRNVRIVATSFFSSGGGRFIGNTNIPDFIVNADYSLSLVKSRSFIVGPEITAGKTLVYGYYSHARIDQNLATDTNGRAIGYGVEGSTAANKTLREATIGFAQTFFRDPKIGALQLLAQYSNVQRTPFSVPAGTPGDANMNMVYVTVRYVLP